eukprot:GGOE01046289.1.p1 GENE.GGOE01046289.1~~GGOE01046289.1.p1  ORF type:complete len:388 (-),score=85.93 GGOE01046289.1:603-1766(-)
MTRSVVIDSQDELDDGCPDSWAIGHPTLSDAMTYFKCCRLSYTHYERKECPKELWKKFNLKVLHKFRDPTEEVAYTVHSRCDPITEKPLEVIFSFRGMIESFEFVDFNPFSAPSNSALNRRTMLLRTDPTPLPPFCGDCPEARFHEGILGYFGRMQEDIDDYLHGPNGLQEFGDTPLVSTGFSMGCGLATLGGLMLKHWATKAGHRPLVNVVTFCSPKVGNRAFANFAYQQLDTFDCYYIKDDPVASYPPEDDFVLSGNVVVFRPVGNDRHLTRASWTYEGFAYTAHPPPLPRLVTDAQMALGIWKESAIPLFNILPDLRRCHVMTAVRDVLLSRPVKRAYVEKLRHDFEVAHPVGSDQLLTPCFLGCPMRGLNTSDISCPLRTAGT